MENSSDKKVVDIFCEEIGIDVHSANDAMAYDSLKGWDSLKHLVIVSRLEEEFGLEFEVDDILDMSTLGKIKNIVARYISVKGQ
jgi:acyl carrier protein